jgi:beta-glucosidase
MDFSNVKKTLEQLTLEEKIALASGADFWCTKEFAEKGVCSIKTSDGPHGVRCQPKDADMLGINESMPATCFPTAVTAGSTWDTELYRLEGEAIAREAAALGVSVLLGPGCNIKRNPLGGRNFEYISEDPYLSGKMAAAFIRGVEGTGVSSCVKHFAINNQEYKRLNGDSMIDERTAREIYLTPFEIAVKEGHPSSIMCSYNKINGTHASDNAWLLTDVLRGEWGFDGTVITDWGAMNDRVESFRAGCDLSMPGGSAYMEDAAIGAVKSGELDKSFVNTSAQRILRLVEKSKHIDRSAADLGAHHVLAERIATEGAVLLKNGGALPLAATDAVIIGSMAKNPRYQGSGSSHINPTKIVSLADAMPTVPFVSAGDGEGRVSEEEIKAAVQAAREHKAPILVIGLPDSYESEAFDREHMRLPEGYIELAKRVGEANENTVVLLLGGSVVELPFIDRVNAVLYMGLGGQALGSAAAKLLTGECSPSGKLTESWPLSYADVISKETFGKKNTEYREGTFVGYRYYATAGVPVRFPFGFGLSYSRFEYSELSVGGTSVTVTVKNAGSILADEIIQLYLSPKERDVLRPKRILCGFERVSLLPGEARAITIDIDPIGYTVWDDGRSRIAGGEYLAEICSDSETVLLSERFAVKGESLSHRGELSGTFYETLSGAPTREEWEKLMGHTVPVPQEPRKGEFTMDSTCLEMKDSSFIMKIQYKITENVVAQSFGGKKDLSNPAYRMMLTCATDGPMRSVVMSSDGKMSEPLARGLLDMANGHFIRGIGKMLGKK